MINQRAKGGEMREVLIQHPLVLSAISTCWMHRCPRQTTTKFAQANKWAAWRGHAIDLYSKVTIYFAEGEGRFWCD